MSQPHGLRWKIPFHHRPCNAELARELVAGMSGRVRCNPAEIIPVLSYGTLFGSRMRRVFLLLLLNAGFMWPAVPPGGLPRAGPLAAPSSSASPASMKPSLPLPLWRLWSSDIGRLLWPPAVPQGVSISSSNIDAALRRPGDGAPPIRVDVSPKQQQPVLMHG